MITVDMNYRDFDPGRIGDTMQQAGLTREEFYGSTKRTAKEIALISPKYPVPLK